MFNDHIISLDGPINGYVVVFDMQGVCLRHLTRVQFGPLRNFMAYIQVDIKLLPLTDLHARQNLNFNFPLPLRLFCFDSF